MRRFAAVLFLAVAVDAWAAAPDAGLREARAVDAVGLGSIAGWIRLHGVEGYLGADVADVMGIPRAESVRRLQAKQRGFRSDKALRIAQLHEESQLILFMVQRDDDQVYFYLSTVRGSLQKAFVSIPGRNLVAPLDAAEAESSFRLEVLYWEDKAAI
jgi:hypothetical protein